MITFSEANQARLSLKMKLHFYPWFDSSVVLPDEEDGFAVTIFVSKIDGEVKKIVPNIHKDVIVKLQQSK
jgi:hypothetical protein